MPVDMRGSSSRNLAAAIVLCLSLSFPHWVKADRTFAVANGCPFSIWPALFTSNATAGLPTVLTGWAAPPGYVKTFSVPDGWSGRIWARENCDFSNTKTDTQCDTGACIGGLVCANSTGNPPASLAEFTLNTPNGDDFYDLSLVDGFNLPIKITSSAPGCHQPTCADPTFNTLCPADLAVNSSTTGLQVGCKSSCAASNGQDTAACCSGPNDTRATCPTSGIPSYQYFHTNCPDSYAYAYDDAAATFTCGPTLNGGASASTINYLVTFCPTSSNTTVLTGANALPSPGQSGVTALADEAPSTLLSAYASAFSGYPTSLSNIEQIMGSTTGFSSMNTMTAAAASASATTGSSRSAANRQKSAVSVFLSLTSLLLLSSIASL